MRSSPESDASERFSQSQFHGVVTILVGISQFPLALVMAGVRTFVVLSGGILLVSVGLNLLRNKDAFTSAWQNNDRYGLLSNILLLLLTIAVVVASASTILFG